MADASRRAARQPARGGLPNALFVVAAAESPPAELTGLADEIRILFPWGSLLRGVLGRDPRVACGITALARPGARVSAIVSVTATDAVDGIDSIDATVIDEVAQDTRLTWIRLPEAWPVDIAMWRGALLE